MHNGGAYGDGTTESGAGIECGAAGRTGKHGQFTLASSGASDSRADRFAERGGKDEPRNCLTIGTDQRDRGQMAATVRGAVGRGTVRRTTPRAAVSVLAPDAISVQYKFCIIGSGLANARCPFRRAPRQMFRRLLSHQLMALVIRGMSRFLENSVSTSTPRGEPSTVFLIARRIFDTTPSTSVWGETY